MGRRLIAFAVLFALTGGSAAAASRPATRVALATRDQGTLLAKGRLDVRLVLPHTRRVRVRVLVRARRLTVQRIRVVRARRATTLRLGLTAAGRRAVGADRAACRATRLTVYVRTRPRLGRRLAKRVLRLRAPAGCRRAGAAPATPETAPRVAGGWDPRPAQYGVVAEENVPITMSDGTVLRGDVYRPADKATGKPAAGRFPVLLAQTPYSKGSTTTTAYASDYGGGGDGRYGGDGFYPYLVQRGYVNAVVEVRGSGSSGGSYDLFSDREIADGPEVVKWAAGLPGSDGDVGLIGVSYVGENQYSTAGMLAPGSPVKAMAPGVGAYDAYRDVFYPGGLFVQGFFNAYFLGLRYPLDAVPPSYAGDDPIGAETALLAHLASIGTFYGPTIARMNAGDLRYDGPYWENTRFRDYLPQIVRNDIPALVIGGHADLHARGEPREYQALQNLWAGRPQDAPMTPGRRTTPRYQLIQGPWYHLVSFQGLRFQHILLEWYDTWLKGADTAFRDARDTAHVFDLGTRKWVDTNAYPYAETDARTLYLGAGGKLAEGKPAAAAGSDGLDYDPGVPLCTKAAEQWTGGIVALGAFDAGQPASTVNPCLADDRPLQAHGLTYTTEPFKSPTTLAGPAAASVYLTSTTTNTELIAVLEDVAPDGASYPLASGQVVGSLRATDEARSLVVGDKLLAPLHPNTPSAEKPVTPGAVERHDIEIFPTFATLATGHRLRITLVTSGNPFLAPVGAEDAQLAGGHYDIQRTASAPSHVNLPLAPAAAFARSPRDYGDCNASC